MQRDYLVKLFAPIRYDLSEDSNPFPEIKLRYEQMKSAESRRRRSPILPAFGAFPYHHTYNRVTEFLDLREEPGGIEPDEFLSRILDSLIGEGVDKPGSPVLFADSKPLAEQIRNSATAIGIAAWLYMNYKLLPEAALKSILQNLAGEAAALPADDETRRKREQFGDRLWRLLRMSPEQKESELADTIARVLKTLREPAQHQTKPPEQSIEDTAS